MPWKNATTASTWYLVGPKPRVRGLERDEVWERAEGVGELVVGSVRVRNALRRVAVVGRLVDEGERADGGAVFEDRGVAGEGGRVNDRERGELGE